MHGSNTAHARSMKLVAAVATCDLIPLCQVFGYLYISLIESTRSFAPLCQIPLAKCIIRIIHLQPCDIKCVLNIRITLQASLPTNVLTMGLKFGLCLMILACATLRT